MDSIYLYGFFKKRIKKGVENTDITVQKDGVVSLAEKENGFVMASLKSPNSAAVTLQKGDRLSILFQIGPTLPKGRRTCLVNIYMRADDKLIIEASRSDDVSLVRR